MLDELRQVRKVVGLKQTVRAVEDGTAEKVFLARDASPDIYNKVVTLCSVNNVKVEYVDSMKQLGEVCRIDVSAAVAALLSE